MKPWIWLTVGLTAPLALRAPGLDAQAPDSAPPAVALSGFATTSFNHSNNAADKTIVGRLYMRRQNEFMLNVAAVTLERVARTERVDAGFRFEPFFGQNAAVVKSTGLDLGANADIWQLYAVLNLPLRGASRHLQLKAGKMATLMGVEMGEDVLNPNADVGNQDIFLEPFTETGVELDGKFGPHFDVELRVSNGWDQVTDLNTGKTVMLRLGLTPDDRTGLGLVGYYGPEQPNTSGPKRSGLNFVASRKLTPRASAWLQLDFGQEDSLGPAGSKARWYAAGLWLAADVASSATLALRGDFVNDRDGVRTSGVLGYPTNTGQKFGSATATLDIRYWAHALLRPEVRYDRSSLPAYAGSKDQVTVGAALSYIF